MRLLSALALAVSLLPAAALAAAPAAAPGKPAAIEELGRRLFFDPALSVNGNQSCATCHGPAAGWAGPDSHVNATGAVYEGSVPGAFGNRRPPPAAYAGDAPALRHVSKEKGWVGGLFWDGRATGARLGDPLAEQAVGPFLNPAEHGLADAAAVVGLVCRASYRELFLEVFGKDACTVAPAEAYDRIGRAIAAFERSGAVSPFSSRFDAWLAGKAKLTAQEERGLRLFEGKAKCSACHPSQRRPDGKPPLFTDFSFDNLGIPRNPMLPFYYQAGNKEGAAWVDPGLGGHLKESGRPPQVYQPELGKFRVPSLRNVDLRPEGLRQGRQVKAFGHNGYFKSLKEVVHFYNTRDLPSARWPAPEYAPTVNREELGNLGLSDQEEDDVVAFLATLSDGPRAGK